MKRKLIKLSLTIAMLHSAIAPNLAYAKIENEAKPIILKNLGYEGYVKGKNSFFGLDKKETGQEEGIHKTQLMIESDVDINIESDKIRARIIDAQSPKLKTVSLIGRARSIHGKSGKAIQIIWYGVEAHKSGSIKSVGLSSHLRSALINKSDVLKKNQPVHAMGDIKGMIKVAESLVGEDEGYEKEEKASETNKGNHKNSALGNTKGSKGSGQIANSFDPDKFKVDKKEKNKRASYDSTDGCEPKIDEAANLVRMTSRKINLKDNQIETKSECQPNGQTMPIERDYNGCAAKINLEHGKAHAQYRKYWINQSGQPQYLGGCQVDEDKEMPLIKDYSSCNPEVDLTNNVALRKYTLKYRDHDGVDVTVKGCTSDKDNVLPIQDQKGGCGLRHDFVAHESHIQTSKFYDDEGNITIVKPCSDSGKTLKHEMDFKGCPVINGENGKPIPQARRIIQVNGVKQVISECAPIEDIESHVHKTRKGCEKEFIHDIDSGQSYPTAQYYVSWDHKKHYISGCVIDEEAVARLLEYDIVDYEHDDARQSSMPIAQHYLKVGNEKILAGEPVALKGQDIPYEFQGAEEKRFGKYHIGCVAHYKRNKVDIYQRPDGSEVEFITAQLEPEEGTNECNEIPDFRTGFYAGCWWTDPGNGYGYQPRSGSASRTQADMNTAANVGAEVGRKLKAISTGCNMQGFQRRDNQSAKVFINVRQSRRLFILKETMDVVEKTPWKNEEFFEGSWPPKAFDKE